MQELAAGVDDTVYGADVLLKFHIKPENISLLEKKLADATAGDVKLAEESEDFFPTSVK